MVHHKIASHETFKMIFIGIHLHFWLGLMYFAVFLPIPLSAVIFLFNA